jgi:predicted nuclease of predicted toxin-antitoxin system
MLVKVDEDLPKAVTRILQEKGHEASSAQEQGMGGWKDEALWRAVQAERRFLVTADKGFADVRNYPPGTHEGILLLRPAKDGIDPLVALLERVIESHSLNALVGAVTVASPRAIRVRRPGLSA